MAIIQIETPTGIEKVEIAGDVPTPQEEAAIRAQFFGAPEASPSEIDMQTATPEEIREYARARRAQGVDPGTGRQLTPQEMVETYREPGVDYTTGVDDVEGFSRVQFGRMETPEEKAAYLETRVGPEGFRTDALGRFILTDQGRQTLGMGEGKEIAIDEEGFSFGDVKEFFGQSGVPIVTGIGASLMASGVGFFPGLLIAGAGAAAGKALDEGVEAMEGLQRQSIDDIARDVAFEGVFAGFGEGVGRGISLAFGRLFKGPGGEANEVLRQQARDMIDRGLRPTVGGATSTEFRPVLNRLQAVYEGVFPNEKAARQNLDILLKELQNAPGVNVGALDEFGDVVRRDIADFYGSADDALAQAQKNLDDTIENEIAKIIQPLKQGKDFPKELVEEIKARKDLFDQDVDKLFSRATDILQGNKIVSTKGIKDALEEIIETSPADIESTKFTRQVRGLSEYATPLEINRLRKSLTDATYDPELVGNVNRGALGRLKSAVEDSMTDTAINLEEGLVALREGYGVGADQAAQARGLNAILRPGAREAEDVYLTVEQVRDGLSLLRRSNQLYSKGIKRFDNVVTQKLIKEAQEGQLDTDAIFDKIITKDNPKALQQLLRAVRGAPSLIKDIGEGRRFVQSQRIGSRSVEEALEVVKGLPANNPTRRMVEQRAAAIAQRAEDVSTLRGTGAEASEALREKLASQYLDDMINKSRITDKLTSEEVIDPIKLAANLRSKGTTVNVLFGKDKAALDDVIKALESGKSNIAPSVLERMPSRNLVDQLNVVKAAQTERQRLSRDTILQRFDTGDVDVIADTLLKTPNAVTVARRTLAPETFEQAKDAAMGRIINQIGGTIEEGGQIRLSGNFFDDFASGRMGSKLQNVLKSYGEQHIDSLFGKNTYNSLFTIADDMTKASNAAIAGKGGLAAPQIALTLGVVGFLTNPIATLGTAVGYAGMSKALRHPKVLRAMMASRSKNSVREFLSGKFKSGDPIGQGFQMALQLAGAGTTQAVRMSGEQTAEEAGPAIERVSQEVQSQLPNLEQLAPAAGTMLEQVNVFEQPSQNRQEVSPILVPDPATRAAFGIQ